MILLFAAALFVGCGGPESSGGQSKEQAATPETTSETTTAESTASKTTAQERPSAGSTAATTEATSEASPSAPAPATTTPSERTSAGGSADVDATVTVTRVVDGDTIEISPAIDGIEDVRLIGVDTPETKKPNCAPQPYGAEASAFTTAELQGRGVGLEFDVERTDRYDRLLAYVYPPDGTMFNETLLREGYAQLATFPPNVRYVERFRAAQEEARSAGKGLWGGSPEELAQQTDRGNGIGGDGCTPPPATQPPPPPPPPEPSPDPADPPVPDVPPPSDFPEPSPEAPSAPAVPAGGARCSDFATEAEALAALPSNPQLDRDGDGQACESLP